MLKVLNYNQEKQRFELIETNYETIDDAIDAADDWLYSNTNHILFDDKLSTIEDLVKQALHHSIYRMKPNGKIYEGEYEVAVDEDELVKMLADDDNQDTLLTLEGKLKSKKIAAI